jgi:hypothetical protein
MTIELDVTTTSWQQYPRDRGVKHKQRPIVIQLPLNVSCDRWFLPSTVPIAATQSVATTNLSIWSIASSEDDLHVDEGAD